MYFNIYVIYHSDIYRKRHIDNIINKLFHQPYIEFIYSNLHKKDIINSSLQNMSINEMAEVLDHYHIWSRIVSSNDDNVINLIIDDSVNLNDKITNIARYMNDIIYDMYNNKTCIDWNILFLYEVVLSPLLSLVFVQSTFYLKLHLSIVCKISLCACFCCICLIT